MKRIFLAILTTSAAALLLPAIAWTAHHETYEGPAAGGVNNATIEFYARFEGTKLKNVHRFHWVNIPATCTPSGSGATSGRMHMRIPVKHDGSFAGTGVQDGGTATVHITGQFTQHDTHAHGTFRLRGPVAGAGQNCDTGAVDWHVRQKAL